MAGDERGASGLQLRPGAEKGATGAQPTRPGVESDSTGASQPPPMAKSFSAGTFQQRPRAGNASADGLRTRPGDAGRAADTRAGIPPLMGIDLTLSNDRSAGREGQRGTRTRATSGHDLGPPRTHTEPRHPPPPPQEPPLAKDDRTHAESRRFPDGEEGETGGHHRHRRNSQGAPPHRKEQQPNDPWGGYGSGAPLPRDDWVSGKLPPKAPPPPNALPTPDEYGDENRLAVRQEFIDAIANMGRDLEKRQALYD